MNDYYENKFFVIQRKVYLLIHSRPILTRELAFAGKYGRNSRQKNERFIFRKLVKEKKTITTNRQSEGMGLLADQHESKIQSIFPDRFS